MRIALLIFLIVSLLSACTKPKNAVERCVEKWCGYENTQAKGLSHCHIRCFEVYIGELQ